MIWVPSVRMQVYFTVYEQLKGLIHSHGWFSKCVCLLMILYETHIIPMFCFRYELWRLFIVIQLVCFKHLLLSNCS